MGEAKRRKLAGTYPTSGDPVAAAVIPLTRESLSISDLEDVARGFMADDPQPFVSMAVPDLPTDWPWKRWPYRATRMWRMGDGTLRPVEVNVHPDTW